MYDGVEIENHSFLPFRVLNSGHTILCVSDNSDCCTEANANWFLPGSTTALTTSSFPYFVIRNTTAPKSVRLSRSIGGVDRDDNDGLYHCEIIGTDGSTQMLYVWLDSGGQGK